MSLKDPICKEKLFVYFNKLLNETEEDSYFYTPTKIDSTSTITNYISDSITISPNLTSHSNLEIEVISIKIPTDTVIYKIEFMLEALAVSSFERKISFYDNIYKNFFSTVIQYNYNLIYDYFVKYKLYLIQNVKISMPCKVSEFYSSKYRLTDSLDTDYDFKENQFDILQNNRHSKDNSGVYFPEKVILQEQNVMNNFQGEVISSEEKLSTNWKSANIIPEDHVTSTIQTIKTVPIQLIPHKTPKILYPKKLTPSDYLPAHKNILKDKSYSIKDDSTTKLETLQLKKKQPKDISTSGKSISVYKQDRKTHSTKRNRKKREFMNVIFFSRHNQRSKSQQSLLKNHLDVSAKRLMNKVKFNTNVTKYFENRTKHNFKDLLKASKSYANTLSKDYTNYDKYLISQYPIGLTKAKLDDEKRVYRFTFYIANDSICMKIFLSFNRIPVKSINKDQYFKWCLTNFQYNSLDLYDDLKKISKSHHSKFAAIQNIATRCKSVVMLSDIFSYKNLGNFRALQLISESKNKVLKCAESVLNHLK